MTLSVVKLKTKEQKQTQTVMDTIMVSPDEVKKWKAPLFQRPVKQNNKVLALAEEMKANGGVWPGVVTLGKIGQDTYIVDGQHRRASFLLSALCEGYVDVRIHYFDSAAEMGEEFVRLNSQLARMNPDDILRGLEGSLKSVQYIRKTCSFVGYDMIRRKETSPIVSMAVVLKCWRASGREVPSTSGVSGQDVAQSFSEEEAEQMCRFLNIAVTSWGRDHEYQRLWGQLNLALSMWLYRQMVLTVNPSKRTVHLNDKQFGRCLMSLSADPVYVDWLTGRSLTERDRSPAFNRLRLIFSKRMTMEMGGKQKMANPSWASNPSFRS